MSLLEWKEYNEDILEQATDLLLLLCAKGTFKRPFVRNSLYKDLHPESALTKFSDEDLWMLALFVDRCCSENITAGRDAMARLVSVLCGQGNFSFSIYSNGLDNLMKVLIKPRFVEKWLSWLDHSRPEMVRMSGVLCLGNTARSGI
jgi:hypothetical protein